MPINQLYFVREKQFDDSIESIAGSYSRMHELDLCIEWILERNPKIGTNLFDGFYLLKSEKLIKSIPPLLILYRHVPSKGEIILIAVKKA